MWDDIADGIGKKWHISTGNVLSLCESTTFLVARYKMNKFILYPRSLVRPNLRFLSCRNIPIKKIPKGIFLIGTPDRIRTYDLLLRKQTLYPAELRVHD